MKEKKARVEDALHATVRRSKKHRRGGRCGADSFAAVLSKLKGDNHDQEAGIKIVLRALEERCAGSSPMPAMNRQWCSTKWSRAKAIWL